MVSFGEAFNSMVAARYILTIRLLGTEPTEISRVQYGLGSIPNLVS